MLEGIGNFVHLIAAVLWVGGVGVLVLVVGPAVRRMGMAEETLAKLRTGVHRIVIPLGLACAGVLAASGVMLMTEDPHFKGWGIYEGAWPKILAAKHLLYLAMVGVAVALWRIKKEETRKDLIDIIFYIGIAVLALTGFLTAVE